MHVRRLLEDVRAFFLVQSNINIFDLPFTLFVTIDMNSRFNRTNFWAVFYRKPSFFAPKHLKN